jgi:hypothetical protein
MKKNSLLIMTAILLSAHLGFAAETQEKSRYEQIVQAFDAETQTFNADFVKDAGDITVVAQHKEALEKKATANKGSWAPAALKVLAGLFGFNAALDTVFSFGTMAGIDYYKSYYPETVHPFWKVMEFAYDYPGYLGLPIRRAMYKAKKPIKEPLQEKLFEMRHEGRRDWSSSNTIGISETTYNIGSGLLDIGLDALPSAAIATYLFKKATSYSTETEKLEKEMVTDTAILEKLQSMQ